MIGTGKEVVNRERENRVDRKKKVVWREEYGEREKKLRFLLNSEGSHKPVHTH